MAASPLRRFLFLYITLTHVLRAVLWQREWFPKEIAMPKLKPFNMITPTPHTKIEEELRKGLPKKPNFIEDKSGNSKPADKRASAGVPGLNRRFF